jgi:hypothetical protein
VVGWVTVVPKPGHHDTQNSTTNTTNRFSGFRYRHDAGKMNTGDDGYDENARNYMT